MKITEILLPRVRPFAGIDYGLYEKEYQLEFSINELIYEGDYKSYPRLDLITRLKTKLKLSIYPDEHDPNNILIQFFSSQINELPPLQQTIRQYGWFISNIQIEQDEYNGDDQSIKLLYQPNYNQAIITLEPLHSNEIVTPNFLYHVTLFPVWDKKIKLYGLSPKSKSTRSTHPERVYFTTTIEMAMDLLNDLAEQQLKKAEQQKYDNAKFNPNEYYNKWVILEIDTTKIPNTRGLSYFRIHHDNNVPSMGKHSAVYSQNFVPPTAIRLVKTE